MCRIFSIIRAHATCMASKEGDIKCSDNHDVHVMGELTYAEVKCSIKIWSETWWV